MGLTFSECLENDDFCIICFEGKLVDSTELEELANLVKTRILEKKNYFIIDLGEVSYINSNGLGVLVQLLTKIRNNGGELYISNVSKKIDELLVTTKLKSIFTIAPVNEILKNSEKYL